MESKKVKSSRKPLVIMILLIIALMILVLYGMPQLLYNLIKEEENDKSEELTTMEQKEESLSDTAPSDDSSAAANAISFPITVEEGKITVENVFQFDGINPDCSNSEGNDIAAIIVKNSSDSYLEHAEITMFSNDGQELSFIVTELPAAKTAMVFSPENVSVEADAVYSSINCEAVFNTEARTCGDKIAISVDGVHITLQNNSDTEFKNLVVYCRSTLGDQYFGGITYTYNINNLPAYGTAELDAADCILGLAEVVRIEINEP